MYVLALIVFENLTAEMDDYLATPGHYIAIMQHPSREIDNGDGKTTSFPIVPRPDKTANISRYVPC